jgi:hypothetical protein
MQNTETTTFALIFGFIPSAMIPGVAAVRELATATADLATYAGHFTNYTPKAERPSAAYTGTPYAIVAGRTPLTTN